MRGGRHPRQTAPLLPAHPAAEQDDRQHAHRHDHQAGHRRSFEPFIGRQPMGRLGRPEEIASTIAYLCSHLAGYISGEYIVVDGGKHASLF